MPYASNTTLLAKDGTGGLWVYKPERGENPLWDFAWRTLAAREVLTYEVATGMGLDLVPETVLADGPFGPGSAQRFVDEDFDFDPRPLFIPRLDRRLWPVAVLDLVCNNADRKIGHVIHDKTDGSLVGDRPRPDLSCRAKAANRPLGIRRRSNPPPLVEALERASRSKLASGLSARVSDLLSEEEAVSLSDRVEELLSAPGSSSPARRPPGGSVAPGLGT